MATIFLEKRWHSPELLLVPRGTSVSDTGLAEPSPLRFSPLASTTMRKGTGPTDIIRPCLFLV